MAVDEFEGKCFWRACQIYPLMPGISPDMVVFKQQTNLPVCFGFGRKADMTFGSLFKSKITIDDGLSRKYLYGLRKLQVRGQIVLDRRSNRNYLGGCTKRNY